MCVLSIPVVIWTPSNRENTPHGLFSTDYSTDGDSWEMCVRYPMLDANCTEDANKVLAGVGKPTAITVSNLFHATVWAKQYIAKAKWQSDPRTTFIACCGDRKARYDGRRRKGGIPDAEAKATTPQPHHPALHGLESPMGQILWSQ